MAGGDRRVAAGGCEGAYNWVGCARGGHRRIRCDPALGRAVGVAKLAMAGDGAPQLRFGVLFVSTCRTAAPVHRRRGPSAPPSRTPLSLPLLTRLPGLALGCDPLVWHGVVGGGALPTTTVALGLVLCSQYTSFPPGLRSYDPASAGEGSRLMTGFGETGIAWPLALRQAGGRTARLARISSSL